MTGSGSDAASLSTTAKRDGDHYILNGSKVMTEMQINSSDFGDLNWESTFWLCVVK